MEIDGSGKMLVVGDMDDYKESGTDDFDMLAAENRGLPETAEVLTGGGGRHLYFWADKTMAFAGKLGRNIDFKVNGYVVALVLSIRCTKVRLSYVPPGGAKAIPRLAFRYRSKPQKFFGVRIGKIH